MQVNVMALLKASLPNATVEVQYMKQKTTYKVI